MIKHRKTTALMILTLMPASLLGACGSNGTTASSTTDAAAATTAAAAGAQPGAAPAGTPPNGTGQAGGTPPNGMPPAGMGTAATGAAATKAGKAATAKYPGTAERVLKLDDGSYVVHVLATSGEQHVKVSAAFKVTGLDTSVPAPPSGQMPQGTTPPAASTATTQS
jgi:hypothetical protein